MSTPVGAGTGLRNFQVEKSDLVIQVNFGARLWALMHNIPLMYEALLREMGEFGVAADGVRSEGGGGSLADYNVNFWALNLRLLVRIRLEGVELQTDMQGVELDYLERAFVSLTRALRVAHKDLPFTTYAVTANLHGQPDGVSAKDYLLDFMGKAPDGLGPISGYGAIFSLEPDPPCSSFTVSAQPSAALAEKVYIGVKSIFDGTAVGPEQLRKMAEEKTNLALNALGLKIEG